MTWSERTQRFVIDLIVASLLVVVLYLAGWFPCH
jgi:hypothetical protein